MVEADIRQMDAMELLRSLPDKSVSAVITDPPYGTTEARWDKAPGWGELIHECVRVSNGAVCMFSQMPVAAELIQADRKDYRYEYVWRKSNAVGFFWAKYKPLRIHELILVFSNPAIHEYNPQMRKGFTPYKGRQDSNRPRNAYQRKKTDYPDMRRGSDGDRYPVDVLEFSSTFKRKMHPTQKPLDLLRWLVRTYSSEGGTILDPYLGSGTTAVAALLENRNVIGSELEDEYISMIHRRLETEAGQTSLSLGV